MAQTKYIEYDTATGRYTGGWVSEELEDPQPLPGRTLVRVEPETAWPAAGSTWNGSAFSSPAPAAVRVIPLRTFLQRCTVAERIAFDVARATNQTFQVLWTELLAGTTVNLDDATLVAGLALIKAGNAANGYQIWPDDATADVRIAAIRA